MPIIDVIGGNQIDRDRIASNSLLKVLLLQSLIAFRFRLFRQHVGLLSRDLDILFICRIIIHRHDRGFRHIFQNRRKLRIAEP